MRAIVSCLCLLMLGSPKLLPAAVNPSWTTPIVPFQIADNLYYVGSQDLASYLIVTPKGNILINANLATSPAQLRASVEALGFHWKDIKILLNSQAHSDHMAGAAEVIRETHAQNMVMEGDVSVVETGARTDFLSPSPNIPRYTPVHVDRVLHDGDTVSLGGVTLMAHKTAGHTRGCTTWTMRSHVPAEPADTTRNIVIVGGTGFWSEYHFVPSHGHPASYPGIVQDFQHTFAVLRALPCDIFLGAHGAYFDMLSKLKRYPKDGPRAFIDPDGYKEYVADAQETFEKTFRTQESAVQSTTHYKYVRIGSPQDAITKPAPGYALMGGGTDLDEAFRWLCTHANGGDFLILRATGSDAYNPYVQPLCKLNSVATLILPTRKSAEDPFAATTIAHAEAIFLAGGDQSNYIRNWTGTPVQTALNAAIARGVPIGGTSAGLAVLGEWAYSAEGDKPDDPNLDSKTALANPFGRRITLIHNFLNIPELKGIITDTHFATRDRMGRLLAFLAQIHSLAPTHPIRGLGIEERAAVLLEPNGHGTVVGHGSAYLVAIIGSGFPLKEGEALTAAFSVQKFESGKTLDLHTENSGTPPYTLGVQSGVLHSKQKSGAIY